MISCSTQAEADSANCALNPTVPGCIVLQDTSIFVCNESFEYNYQTGQEKQPYMQLYRCDCKWDATNKTGTCNGKTNVNPKTDCELVMNIPGTCNENGYQQGPSIPTLPGVVQHAMRLSVKSAICVITAPATLLHAVVTGTATMLTNK